MQPTKLDVDVLSVLLNAKSRVKQGWCQGAFYKGDKVCMASSLLSSWGDDVTKHSMVCVAAVIGVPAVVYNLVDWNDDPSTTKADVLAAFDSAIALVTGATR